MSKQKGAGSAVIQSSTAPSVHYMNSTGGMLTGRRFIISGLDVDIDVCPYCHFAGTKASVKSHISKKHKKTLGDSPHAE